MKHLHKFFNREDITWVHLVWEKYYSNGSLPSSQKKGSFRWRDILKLLDAYKEMAMVNIQDGVSCLFWDDLWLNRVHKIQYPKLFSFARNTRISLRFALEVEGSNNLFHLPISAIAL